MYGVDHICCPAAPTNKSTALLPVTNINHVKRLQQLAVLGAETCVITPKCHFIIFFLLIYIIISNNNVTKDYSQICRFMSTKLHSITSQKILMLLITVMISWNHIFYESFLYDLFSMWTHFAVFASGLYWTCNNLFYQKSFSLYTINRKRTDIAVHTKQSYLVSCRPLFMSLGCQCSRYHVL
jgi:hypothetical protein